MRKMWVEVTLSRVRRERMGHIELATPVAHMVLEISSFKNGHGSGYDA